MVHSCLDNDEPLTAVQWMDKMVLNKKKIYDAVYSHWLKNCDTDPFPYVHWETFSSHLSRSQGVYISESIAIQLKDVLERRLGVDGCFTSVALPTGRCRFCSHSLESPKISEKEFNALKKAMFERVLTGSDVYHNSNPPELKRFQEFVEKTAPYDVVIDGLNVGYMGNSGPGTGGADNGLKARKVSN